MIVPKIDTLKFIRAHPQMFLPKGVDPGAYLANLIAEMASLRGAKATTIEQRDGWWKIASEFDWLHDQPLDERPNAFCDMIPFPGGGRFAFYPEVLLTAYATHVVSTRDGYLVCIPPDWKVPDSVRDWMRSQAGRSVGFTMAADFVTERPH